MDDLISRQLALDAITAIDEGDNVDISTYEVRDLLNGLPSAKPTLYGFPYQHLELIAIILQKENLPPERVAECLTDIGRIVETVKDEFEEALRKAMNNEDSDSL